MHKDITPVVLTLNEEANLGRTLDMLTWAKEVVLLDSGSTDATLEIASKYANVRVLTRPFDSHANQWDHAVFHTGIQTDWILALDADYVLSAALIAELGLLMAEKDVSGFRAQFVYCVEGRPLRATVYTPVTVLFRRERARYIQDGHTQRISVDGSVHALSGTIFHDDRKTLSRWIAAQDRYMRLEAEKLIRTNWSNLGWSGRIRQLRVIAPFAMLFYCLVLRRLIFDGRAGLFYSFQRAFAELLLSLRLLQHDLSSRSNVSD